MNAEWPLRPGTFSFTINSKNNKKHYSNNNNNNMGKFKRVIIMEVQEATNKDESTGMMYRYDTPWLVEAFKSQNVEVEVLYITGQDTAASLTAKYPDTAFFGRVNPRKYACISMKGYMNLLDDLKKSGVLLGPDATQMDRLGSKMILYKMKDTLMGVADTKIHTMKDLSENPNEIDRILPKGGPPRVLKVLRGSTGFGVWMLENKDDNTIKFKDAFTNTDTVLARDQLVPKFLELSTEDAISMPFLPLIKEGEIRILMSRHHVLEMVFMKPGEGTVMALTTTGGQFDCMDLQKNKHVVDAVSRWSYELKKVAELDDVPFYWSVDCIEEEVGAEGLKPGHIPGIHPGRRVALSEINCSCLGLSVGTTAEAVEKSKHIAKLIAEIVLN